MKLWQHGKSSSCPVREEVLSAVHNWYFCNSHHWSCISASTTVLHAHRLWHQLHWQLGDLQVSDCTFTRCCQRQMPWWTPGMSLQCCWQTNTHTGPGTKGRRKRLRACCCWPSLQTASPQQHKRDQPYNTSGARNKTNPNSDHSSFSFSIATGGTDRCKRSECNPCYSTHIYLYSKAEVI